MIVYLAEITCYGCHKVVQSTSHTFPRTQKDHEAEFRITFHYRKYNRDGGEVWLCQQCQHIQKSRGEK